MLKFFHLEKKIKKKSFPKSVPKSKKETPVAPKNENAMNSINAKKSYQNIIINNNIIASKTDSANNLSLTKTFMNRLENKRISIVSPSKSQAHKNGSNTTTHKELRAQNLNINITVINNTISPSINTVRKKDAETQTEEIFFKSHWTYFQAKNYSVLSAKSSSTNNKVVMSNNFNTRASGGFSSLSGLISNNNLYSNSKTKSYSLEKRGLYSNGSNSGSGNLQEINDYVSTSAVNSTLNNSKINFSNALGKNIINKINSMNNLGNLYKSSIKSLSSGGKGKDF
jgi:hypothetical protein